MDTKQQTAIETRLRESAEDTVIAVEERMIVWKREKRLAVDVEPVLAQREEDIIMVWFDDGSVGIILMDTPDRSTLDGV